MTRLRSRRRSIGLLALALIALSTRPAMAQRGDPPAHDASAATARLRGTVTRRGNDTPVANADVWLVSLDRHAQSDSAGVFRFEGLPTGQFVIEIRHIGFDLGRETVALETGRETVRKLVLARNAQPLDTVRTLAGKQTYISPMLRGFEQRRLAGQGGRFISDSVLRANENTNLANILGRIPGATITSGPRGSRVLVSTRKGCLGPALKACGHPNCYVEIHIDGALVFSPAMLEKDPNNPALFPPDLARMGLTDFAGIEFYADAASMPIDMHSSQDEGCGSLWLWTREK